jgi:hypothetical protein
MPTAGPSPPSTGTNNNAVGAVAWTNPGNVTAEDGNSATATVGLASDSQYLFATGFGFSIPAGAVIQGIQAGVKHACMNGDVQDEKIRIIKGGVVGTTDRSSASAWPTSLTFAQYGGGSDLWGLTWLPSDINASNFGLAIQAQSSFSDTAAIDVVYITITYTLSTTGIPGSLTSTGVGN